MALVGWGWGGEGGRWAGGTVCVGGGGRGRAFGGGLVDVCGCVGAGGGRWSGWLVGRSCPLLTPVPLLTDSHANPQPQPHTGSFRDKIRTGELEKINLSEQIAVRQDAAATQSHTAGFEVRQGEGTRLPDDGKLWEYT